MSCEGRILLLRSDDSHPPSPAPCPVGVVGEMLQEALINIRNSDRRHRNLPFAEVSDRLRVNVVAISFGGCPLLAPLSGQYHITRIVCFSNVYAFYVFFACRCWHIPVVFVVRRCLRARYSAGDNAFCFRWRQQSTNLSSDFVFIHWRWRWRVIFYSTLMTRLSQSEINHLLPWIWYAVGIVEWGPPCLRILHTPRNVLYAFPRCEDQRPWAL